MRIDTSIFLSATYCLLVSACGEQTVWKVPKIEANHEAQLEIFCGFGCDEWENYTPTDYGSSSSVKKIVLRNDDLERLKKLRLSDSCATTPDIYVNIKTDTGFEQTWSITVAPNDVPTRQCTFGRNQAQQTEFEAFFIDHIVGSP